MALKLRREFRLNIISRLSTLRPIRTMQRGIAQKFSALLNVMFDGLEELADCTTTRPELAGLVRKVSLAAVRGEKLVQQLLAFSQPKSLSFETVSLDTFISSMEKGLFEAAG